MLILRPRLDLGEVGVGFADHPYLAGEVFLKASCSSGSALWRRGLGLFRE